MVIKQRKKFNRTREKYLPPIYVPCYLIVSDVLNNRKNHRVDPKLMDLRIFSNPLLIPLCFHQEQNCRVVNRGENWSKGLQWISHYFNEWLYIDICVRHSCLSCQTVHHHRDSIFFLFGFSIIPRKILGFGQFSV